ncbi:MAG: copper chaperone [Glaciecola sp.]|jgi:copper chaperone
MTTTAKVTGMTCQHCVASVTEEVTAIDQVTGVAVNLIRGLVSIESPAPIDEAIVRAAIEEAGYEMSDYQITT